MLLLKPVAPKNSLLVMSNKSKLKWNCLGRCKHHLVAIKDGDGGLISLLHKCVCIKVAAYDVSSEGFDGHAVASSRSKLRRTWWRSQVAEAATPSASRDDGCNGAADLVCRMGASVLSCSKDHT